MRNHPSIFIILIVPAFFIFCFSVVSAQEIAPSSPLPSLAPTIELPELPLDPFIKKWIGDGQWRFKAKELINYIKSRTQRIATIEFANTPPTEKSPNSQISSLSQKLQTYIRGVAAKIQMSIINLAGDTAAFFKNLFNQTSKY